MQSNGGGVETENLDIENVLSTELSGRQSATYDFWRAWPVDDPKLRARFDTALRAWKRDTRYQSSLTRIVVHPSYQAIIGMGSAALPFIFGEMQQHGGHWLWALHAITQEDPTRPGDDFATAVDAWLAWGRAHGYLA